MKKFQFQSQILVLAALILPAMPVHAQEAAFESPEPAPQARPTQPMPQQAAAPVSTGSNLRHWTRFSQSSSSSVFRRVAPGTKFNSGTSHYVRPQHFEPGVVPRAQANAAGQRHLAYNVPVGGTVQSQINASKNAAHSHQPGHAGHNSAVILGYGKHSGEITSTPAPTHRWNGTPISCYGRYN